MAQIYLRSDDLKWQQAPSKDDVELAAALLFKEAVGYQGQLYKDLAPRKVEPKSDGALGSPPAIFVRVSNQPKESSFMEDFRWFKGIEKNKVQYGTISEFLEDRKKAGKPVDWPEFEARIKESNHKDAGGSRTGDILFVTDGVAGYLAVNQPDGLNGWHGGPTVSESYVPLMFGMPGPALVLPKGQKNPAFIQKGFDEGLKKLVKDRQLQDPNGFLRNWHCSPILTSIVKQVRSPNDP